MKLINTYKTFFLILIVSSLLSCKNDTPTIDLEENLYGSWTRSDQTIEFEYQLVFDTNHTGMRTERIGDPEGQGISSALMFTWSTNADLLQLDYDGELSSTPFFFNEEGHLFLTNLSEHYFIKTEE